MRWGSAGIRDLICCTAGNYPCIPAGEIYVEDTRPAIYARVERAFAEMNFWQGLWQNILYRMVPNSNDYHRVSGTHKQINVYDNTAMYFTNRGRRFDRLSAPVQESAGWLHRQFEKIGFKR
jgi:hypothetical protein